MSRQPSGEGRAEDVALLDLVREGDLRGHARFAIPAGSALFAGHFPGRPILPGIAHLALLERTLAALAPAAAAALACREVHGLKLRHPIGPDDLIELRCAPLADGRPVGVTPGGEPLAGEPGAHRVGFTLRCGGEVASSGTVRLVVRDTHERGVGGAPAQGSVGAAADAEGGASGVAEAGTEREAAGGSKPASGTTAGVPPPLATAVAAGSSRAYPSAAALLPHGPPARLITGLLAVSPEALVCSAAIAPEHALGRGGHAPSYVALEAAAQCAAVAEALARTATAPGPRIGYLVGIRHALLGADLPLGHPLRVTVRPAGSAPPLAVYEIRVELAGGRAGNLEGGRAGDLDGGLAGTPFATGTISTYRT